MFRLTELAEGISSTDLLNSSLFTNPTAFDKRYLLIDRWRVKLAESSVSFCESTEKAALFVFGSNVPLVGLQPMNLDQYYISNYILTSLCDNIFQSIYHLASEKNVASFLNASSTFNVTHEAVQSVFDTCLENQKTTIDAKYHECIDNVGSLIKNLMLDYPFEFACSHPYNFESKYKNFSGIYHDLWSACQVALKKNHNISSSEVTLTEADLKFLGHWQLGDPNNKLDCFTYALLKLHEEKAKYKIAWEGIELTYDYLISLGYKCIPEPSANENELTLVLYHRDPSLGCKITHAGIYKGNGKVESKWGNGDVNLHDQFKVPFIYGQHLTYMAKIKD